MGDKKTPGNRRRVGGVRAVRVPIRKAKKISSEDVEEAIERQLASTKTDVFGNNDTLVIVVEKYGK